MGKCARKLRGDPIAGTALEIVEGRGVGSLANQHLGSALRTRSPTMGGPALATEMRAIGVELMRQHVSAVKQFGNPSSEQVARYHHQVFRDHGLPPSTFGGTIATGSESEANVTAPAWRSCP